MLHNGGSWSFSDIDLLMPHMNPLATHQPSAIIRLAGMMEDTPLTVDDIIASIFKAPSYACAEIIAPVLR